MSRKDRRFPKILSEEDLKLICNYISKAHWYQNNVIGEFHKWRDASAAIIMFYTGGRPKEILNRKWSDIDYEQKVMKINLEDNKERNNIPIVLCTKCINALLGYKEVLNKLGIISEYLFPSMWTWKPLTTDAYGKRFQRIVREAGLSEFSYYDDGGMPHYTVSPYINRHSFATAIEEKFGDPIITQKLLRQTTLSATSIYTHVALERKKELVEQVFG